MSAVAEGTKEKKTERSARGKYRREQDGPGLGNQNARKTGNSSGRETRIHRAAPVAPDRRAGIGACRTRTASPRAAWHSAVVFALTPAASRQIRLVVRAEQRAQQRQAEQQKKQDCRNAPQAT